MQHNLAGNYLACDFEFQYPLTDRGGCNGVEGKVLNAVSNFSIH